MCAQRRWFGFVCESSFYSSLLSVCVSSQGIYSLSSLGSDTMVKQKEVEDTVVIRSCFSWVRISSEAQTVQELDSCHCTGTSRQDGCGNEWPMLARCSYKTFSFHRLLLFNHHLWGPGAYQELRQNHRHTAAEHGGAGLHSPLGATEDAEQGPGFPLVSAGSWHYFLGKKPGR